MFNKLLFAIAVFTMSIGVTFAAVDVNKATAAQLDSIKGIGPATSKAIVDERTKGGAFKDWNDFQSRVKGIGEKSSAKMSDSGLTVEGKAYAATSSKAAPSKTEEKKPLVADAKKEEAKPALNKDAKAKKEDKTEVKK
jgi:competence protein ComEA